MNQPLYDLDQISRIVALKHGWDDAIRQAILDEYIEYLRSVATSESFLEVPSKEVDMLWHEHILHSITYTDDCEAWFGRYIHHTPCLQPDALRALGRPMNSFQVEGDCGGPNCGGGDKVWSLHLRGSHSRERAAKYDCGASGPAEEIMN